MQRDYVSIPMEEYVNHSKFLSTLIRYPILVTIW